MRILQIIAACTVVMTFAAAAELKAGKLFIQPTLWYSGCSQGGYGFTDDCRDPDLGPVVYEAYTYNFCAVSQTSDGRGGKLTTGGCSTPDEAFQRYSAWLLSQPQNSNNPYLCSISAVGMFPENWEAMETGGAGNAIVYQRGGYTADFIYGGQPWGTCTNTTTSRGSVLVTAYSSATCPPGFVNHNSHCQKPAVDCCVALGNPIQIGAAAKIQREEDFPSLANNMSIGFQRYYSSLNTSYRHISGSRKGFGDSWRHSYERGVVSVTVSGRESLLAVRDDGTQIGFFQSSGVWASPYHPSYSLTEIKTTGVRSGWRLLNSQSEFETYDLSGKLLSVHGHNGSMLNMVYSDGTAAGASGGTFTDNGAALPAGWLLFVNDWTGRLFEVQLRFVGTNFSTFEIGRVSNYVRIRWLTPPD